MESSEIGRTILGVMAWAGVAVFSVIAVANWDPLWGFFPVLAAVVLAWAAGEYITRFDAPDGS